MFYFILWTVDVLNIFVNVLSRTVEIRRENFLFNFGFLTPKVL